MVVGGSVIAGLCTIGLLRKISMPWFSAMKFRSSLFVKKCLSNTERALYTQRSEEARIASILKHSREVFFVITGPKKVGKSYMLMHMADTSLKKHALYLKLEHKTNNVNEIYRRIAKAVGYHHIYEESLLKAFFCPWKLFQPVRVEHFELVDYLKKVGQVYERISKGKLPILILDEVVPLATNGDKGLDDLAYMAKSFATSRTMTVVFGLLDAFGPNVLNNSGYAMNKETIYLNYMVQQEIMNYAVKVFPKRHPLRQKILRAISAENKRLYGGNLLYIDLLMSQLKYAKDDKDIEKEKKYTEDKVMFDIGDELKKTFFKDQTPESSIKMSLLKAFAALSKKKQLSLDTYLSFFNRADQPLASQFIYNFMILKEYKDVVTFRGPPVEYYIVKNVLNKYAYSITKEDEMKLQKDIIEFKNFIIENTIVSRSNFKWADIIGMDDVKQKIIETIIFPTLNPSIFTGLRSPARGVLLYGPSGNGKTLTAKVIASEYEKGITFFKIDPSTFSANPFNQDPDKVIKALFQVAGERQPSIIFIDEIDLIMSKRGPNDTEQSRKLKNEFLIQFHGLTSGEQSQVVAIGASNKIENIDDAILRRFTVRINLDWPLPEARKKMIKTMISNVNSELSESDYNIIVSNTEHFSFANLSELCREASYEPIRELSINQLASMKSKDVRPLRLKDFNEALFRLKKVETSSPEKKKK